MEPIRVPDPSEVVRLNWLEKSIGWLSPSWGRDRLMAKMQAENLASYRGARHTRLGRAIPGGGRADFHLESELDRRELVDRARQLERSSVIAEGLLSRAQENVVGNGFKLQAQSSNEGWNEKTEAAFAEWAEFEADVRGLSTLDELLALTYRSWLRDGDVGTLLLSDGRIQSIESDQIANPNGANFPTRELVDGVKLDERGRPVSFYVVQNPDPMFSSVRFGNDFTEIPADQVLFMARRQRHGQTRGLSAFSGVAWLLDQIDGHIEAVTAAARMAACMGIVVARNGRMGGLTTATNSAGDSARSLTFEPGMLWELNQGDVATQIKQEHQSDLAEFLATLGRLVGLSFGLPLEVAFLDFSRTNYSSARAALLQAHQVWQVHQTMLRRYMSRIYRWWLLNAMERGEVKVRSDALAHTWIVPGWKWVDPEKELNAQLGAVDAGIMTLSDIAQSQGRDFFELVKAREKEVKALREAGLPEIRSSMTRDPGAVVDPAAEEDQQAQEEAMRAEREHLRAQIEREEMGRRYAESRREENLVAAITAMAGRRETIEIVQPPAQLVTVESPAVHMAAPEAPSILVQVPESPAPIVNVDVHVPEQAAPVVNVAAPNVSVAAPSVSVAVPDPKPRVLRVVRDENGNIIGGDVSGG